MNVPGSRRRARGDFRVRIAAAVAGVAVAVGVALTLTTIVRETREAKQELDHRGRMLAVSMAQRLLIAVLAEDRADAEAAARFYLQVPDVVGVTAYGRQRPFIAMGRAAGPPPPPLAPGELAVRRIGDEALVYFAPVFLEPTLDEESVLDRPQPELVGMVGAVLSLERLHADRASTMRLNTVLLAAALTLAILAAALVARRIARPIERLIHAAEQIGRGRTDVQVPVESADTIGRLSSTFNKMVADLRVLAESKLKFLAVISHELRTPLVPIKGYLELADRGGLGPIPEQMRRPLKVLARNADRLVENVETLLLYSLLTAGELSLVRARVDLRECLRRATENLRPRLKEKRLSLEISLGDASLWVMGDEARLTLLFELLLSNACKFSPDEGAIGARAFADGPVAVAEVVDHGIGIPEELQSRIFEGFYQVHPAITRPYGGIGLGLALARELVVRHEGTIRVQSRVGEGSTFRVELRGAASVEALGRHPAS